MHTPAALRIPPEIQEIICSDKALSRKDRARLARVCKHWHAVADAAVWRHIGGLESLLRLLPKDAWTEPRDEYGMSMPHCVHLSRRLTAVDWEPVLRKSRLVQTLSLDYVDNATQWAIVDCPPPQALFPALRILNIDDCFEYSPFDCESDFIQVLVPPTLRELHISSTYKDMSSTAACVARCCRASLTTLDLDNQDYRVNRRGDNQEIDDDDANIYGLCDLVDELKQCQRLTNFSLKLATPWFPQVFEKLSECPGLTDLDVYLSSEDSPSYEWEDHPPRYGDYRFPALRRLHLHGVSFGDVMDILESKEENPDDAPFREMEAIGICGGPGDSSGALASLTTYIENWCDAAVLRRVSIERDDDSDEREDFQEWPLTFDHIAPLTAFRHLTHVRLAGLHGTRLTDADCEEMAVAWPALQELVLNVTPNYAEGTACTLAALVPFARNCPHLRVLELPLDAARVPQTVPLRTEPSQTEPSQSELPSERDAEHVERSHTPLLLRITYGAIDDEESVVRYLRALFHCATLDVQYKTGYRPRGGLDQKEQDRRIRSWGNVDALLSRRPVLKALTPPDRPAVAPSQVSNTGTPTEEEYQWYDFECDCGCG
ncbi:uncharacterized protein SCHCODRAFT_02642752 [Schizophyllum commune H4-8]|nr:uncharacterized protein SCHCODRAFT_02642752 [Schizophyllum commune H4-8]KAI5885899.1 hypothetical protein SCHCODRAFT_02642752 [Schizophyllum commune H4-8]